MLVASLEPEIYLKSNRTQRRMVGVLVDAIADAFDGEVSVERIAGHRLVVGSTAPDAVDRLSRVFGVRAVETVEQVAASDLEGLAEAVAAQFGEMVRGRTFAVRPNRIGSHEWSSQDVAVLAGRLLVEAGGSVDLSAPEVTVAVRIVEDDAYLTLEVTPGVGGLPAGTQGRALMMFSGGTTPSLARIC